jgi:hypothetical protein
MSVVINPAKEWEIANGSVIYSPVTRTDNDFGADWLARRNDAVGVTVLEAVESLTEKSISQRWKLCGSDQRPTKKLKSMPVSEYVEGGLATLRLTRSSLPKFSKNRSMWADIGRR